MSSVLRAIKRAVWCRRHHQWRDNTERTQTILAARGARNIPTRSWTRHACPACSDHPAFEFDATENQ